MDFKTGGEVMAIGVLLHFDRESERRIRGTWIKICNDGICSEMINSCARPHISLGGFDNVDSDFIVKRMKENLSSFKKQRIQFTSISTFMNEHGVVYLAPRVTPDLLSFNVRFNEIFADIEDKKIKIYTPGYWVPHCTLALNIPREKVLHAIDIALDSFEPFYAEIMVMGFVEFYPIKYRQDLDMMMY